jgi:hypothetical protein
VKGVQTLRDEVTQECKFTTDALMSPLCDVATKALKVVTAFKTNVDGDLTELAAAVTKQCSPPPASAATSGNCLKAQRLQYIAIKLAGAGEGIEFDDL